MEMKTVIALPDEVFAAAEVLARRLGVSRAALYAQAVAEFVACHRRLGGTERPDAVRGDDMAVARRDACPSSATCRHGESSG